MTRRGAPLTARCSCREVLMPSGSLAHHVAIDHVVRLAPPKFALYVARNLPSMYTGQEVRNSRSRKQMTQAALAAQSGVSIDTIRRFERTPGQLPATRTVQALISVLESVDSGTAREPSA